MISSEVERTLVKSPPELWTELSDPAALARHLGEFGEIRITRVEPEQAVEWEAENATGTVLIKASGWGTKVTLSVTREAPEPEALQAPETQPAPETPPEPEAVLSSPEQPPPDQVPSEPVPEPEPEAEIEPAAEVEPEPAPEPAPELAPELECAPAAELPSAPELAREPRRGFFARLFGRRRLDPEPELSPPAHSTNADDSTVEPTDAFAAVSRVLGPETFAGGRATVTPWPEPAAEAAPPADAVSEASAEAEAPAEAEASAEAEAPIEAEATSEKQAPPPVETAGMSAEIKAAEEVAAAEVTAVLTSVLDRLGAAHHRPFSRS